MQESKKDYNLFRWRSSNDGWITTSSEDSKKVKERFINLPFAVVHCCGAKHNFHAWETLVQIVHSKGFFVCGSSNQEYYDFLGPS